MIHIKGEKARSLLSNVQPADIQPNAVDLRIDKVFKIRPHLFTISEDDKHHRGSLELPPDDKHWWKLDIGAYEIVMTNIITVGADEAGFVITRSTLNRNGVFITSGLYDSGYHGNMAGCLHITTGPIAIQRGTRVGQFLLFKAEALHFYNGSYGLASDHDKKYQSQ